MARDISRTWIPRGSGADIDSPNAKCEIVRLNSLEVDKMLHKATSYLGSLYISMKAIAYKATRGYGNSPAEVSWPLRS